MEEQATPPTVAPVATPGQVAEPAADTAQSRTYVQFPTDKLRELNRKASAFDRQQREGQHFSNPTPTPSMDPDAEKAVGIIADATAKRMSGEIGDVRDELDTMRFERTMQEIEKNPNSKYLRDEIVEEYSRLLDSSPRSKKSDLLEQAQKEAVSRAFSSGTLIERIAQDAVNAALEAQAAKRSVSSGPAPVVKTDDGAKDYRSMSSTEIASLSEEEFREATAALVGGRPRRMR